jgi:protein-tyrosine phosphatase
MKRIIGLLVLAIPLFVDAQIADSSLRMVKLNGAVNFRDIGGYVTKNGKKVKLGKIYRSAEINNLSSDDLNKLDQLGINYVLDFRGPAEVTAAPDKLPPHATRISLPFGSENTGDRMKMMKSMSEAKTADSIMLPYYANIEPFAKRYRPVFETLLQNSKDSAILFHCTAGKDRTGIGAALILFALGVDEKTIMEDYLASNYYRKPDNERMKNMLVTAYHMNEDVVAGVLGVRESYLQATFDAIKSKYGTIDNYLKIEMGLDKRNERILKDKYLQ